MEKEAAEIKSDFPVSFADAFCIGLAQRINGQVLTNDPEYADKIRHLRNYGSKVKYYNDAAGFSFVEEIHFRQNYFP